ncbi:hypothetical protein TNCV_847931 [Trichonephila clavipes]|uniref:Uncharacterized protein n=1 Tax=Trichonephila clavipes TaxID=2585209 RepID=A0A8X6RU82_TRICX|nr:hypothetical protein TNCV_847931 [Trichonephila clavipes]
MVVVMNSCPQCSSPGTTKKFSVEEELMHVKHVEVKSPHVGVMWKFGRELSAQATAVNEKPPVSKNTETEKP